MSALTTRIRPKSASCGGPTMRITTSMDPSSALKRVRRLDFRMLPTLRLVTSTARFDWPRANRSPTWSALRPLARIACATATPVGSAGVPVEPRSDQRAQEPGQENAQDRNAQRDERDAGGVGAGH